MKRRTEKGSLTHGGPLWYKDAVIYEVPVRAFRDSNGDGIGDFKGLVEKLDYLHDLGVTALWLLPFYPSPLRDDGYDIADYRDVNPIYGTLADFKLFLREAHRRGLRVVTELVVNHTSDQHPWFQRARRAPAGSPERDFYVWSDTPDRYREARIIFKDFETSNWTWDPVAKAYYWHRFYGHQPDLNYDNPAVQKAVFDALDYWLEMGIDGLRLDAIPYLYEREGTNCENLPETHAFLKRLRAHVDARYPGRMLLAEANQWPEDAVAYFGSGDGDECHMAFHFPVMPRLFMAIRMEDRLPVLDILQQTPPIPATCQWAMFLRNHDELTLEMVTDEDRDYMYRVYARDPQARINLGIRRRLGPLLENHRAKIELMNGLLFSLPGTPVLYYGDEIGMGDNIYLGDRNGVRTPMQWNAERNAGFSAANPQSLYLPAIIDPEYHFQAVNVEVQQNNPHSLLWWTKRLIDLRKRHPAFGRGSIAFLTPENHKVLAFVRSYAGGGGAAANGRANGPDDILVVANLSRFPQYVELDLAAFAGRTPVELMGRTAFPPVGDRPYFLTLGGYAFHWFALQTRHAPTPAAEPAEVLPTFTTAGRWDGVLHGPGKDALQDWLPQYLPRCPWFAGKDRQAEAAMVLEAVPVPYGGATAHIALVQVEYSEGDPETYALPLAFAGGEEADRVRAERPEAVVGLLRVEPGEGGAAAVGVLYDPVGDRAFARELLEAVFSNRRYKRAAAGELVAAPLTEPAPAPAKGPARKKGRAGRAAAVAAPAVPAVEATLLRDEQRNTSLVYGDRYVLKLFRRVEEGVNPEVEVGTFLARAGFRNVPRLAGTLQYRRGWGEPMALGVLHEFVPHQGDGWRYCKDALSLYFERALTRPAPAPELPLPALPAARPDGEPVPAPAAEAIGPALEMARLLGRRTGELHLALASGGDDPAFAPEPFTSLYQRSLYQSLRSQTRKTFARLRRLRDRLPEEARAAASRLAEREEELLTRVRRVYEVKIAAEKTRTHGDFDLREILYDGRDVTVIDLEGDAQRPLSDRRRKHTPLRDVASMLRSFHYAALAALHGGGVRREDRPALEPWARLWHTWVSAAFLHAYRAAASAGTFLPADPGQFETLLDFYLVKRAISELHFELSHAEAAGPGAMPAGGGRVAFPVEGLLQLLGAGG